MFVSFIQFIFDLYHSAVSRSSQSSIVGVMLKMKVMVLLYDVM